MFFIVGAGLKPEHLTLEGLEVLKKCDRVFLETYTSAFSEGKTSDLEKIIGKKIFALSRSKLEEDSRELLRLAKKNNVGLIVFGNPLTATTHIQMVLDAHKQRIKTQIVSGISVTNFLAKTGLDEYRFGRACTIAEHKPNFEPDSFFDIIEKNQKSNLHTLCFLDTGEGNKFLSVGEALKILEKIEKNRKSDLLQKSTFVVLAGAGAKNEQIMWGDLKKIKRSGINAFPQSLIICATLNEKEKEAMGALHE